MSFVHLHSHSEYSMLDGASRITQMFERAKQLDMPAIALTDHGVMYGAIPFYLEGKAAGVKPLVGMEAYVAPGSRFDRPVDREDRYFHLTMIAQNRQGYKNLMKLSSQGFLEGYAPGARRPRIDKEIIGQYSEGIIVLSGCLSSELARNLTSGKPDAAIEVASQYKEIFGDRYFLEIQNQGVEGQHALNAQIRQIGKKLGIPLVATNDSHYTHKEDAHAHDVLLCIQTGQELANTKRMKFDTDEFYVKSREEMLAAFPEYPDAIENTVGVAEMCDLDIELHKMLLPVFEVPPGETLSSFLYKLTEDGIRSRYGTPSAEVEERYRMELKVIDEMGFSGYFLIVSDFVGWAKQNRIRVGPGRGSVGGSIVAYALGITELDPIRWKLPFERFLNPGRKSMPDIDIDFDKRRRGEVIRYVSERYGHDHVAQIITFSTIKAKAALRDAARVLGHPYAVGDRLTKMYPPLILGKDAPFEACFNKSVEWPDIGGGNQAYSNAAELRKAYEEDPVSKLVIDTARQLEGLRRQHSVHAAAVVIGHEPLTNHVPVQRTDGEIVTQYEMNAVADIGLLKMDFLGLRNLTVIEDAVGHIRRNKGVDIDIDRVPLDDETTFKLLQRAMSAGVFQMDSPGMTRLLKQLRIDRFEEIAALIALYRPGPMEQIKHYVKGKHEPSSVTYYHPLLEPVLRDTNGVIVYQEQVMEMFQVVAGFSAQEADMVRAAIAKKQSKELVKWKDQFEKGCAAAGLDAAQAHGLWDLILPFAGYSFNRAHAFGYALVAYQTAWLKANHPTEYMAALLASVKDDKDQMTFYLSECRAMGIKVHPPSVNDSELDFTPRDSEILFGLSAIRNVGEKVSEQIIAARSKAGPFTGFHDFSRRVDVGCLNKKVIEALAKAGAFDCLGVERSALLAPGADDKLVMCDQAGRLIDAVLSERRSEDAGQFSLFASSSAPSSAPSSTSGTEVVPENFDSSLIGIEISRSELLAAEKEMLGVYVSDHPLAAVEAALRYQTEVDVLQAREGPDGTIRSVGGILGSLVRKFTKKGDIWYTGVLEDMKGTIEVVLWPQTAQQTSSDVLIDDQIVIVKGRIELREDACKLIAMEVRRPDLDGATSPLRIRMSASGCTPDRLEQLKGVLSEHPGPSPVLLHLESASRTTVLKLGGFSVELRNGLFAEIKAVLGPQSLV